MPLPRVMLSTRELIGLAVLRLAQEDLRPFYLGRRSARGMVVIKDYRKRRQGL